MPNLCENYLKLHERDVFVEAAKCLIRMKRMNESSEPTTKLIKETDEGDYFIREEDWSGFTADGSGEPMRMTSAYTKDGKYIGDPKFVELLNDKYGISQFDVSDPNNKVCSIGFNPDENKWYGWSHRAMSGFGVGDKLFDQNYAPEGQDVEKMPFIERGEATIENMDQAKQAAKNFASYVS